MATTRSSLLVFFTHAKESCRGIRTKVSEKIEPKPVQNEKLVKIAIIGTPNAGKSTFINNLLNHRVSIVKRRELHSLSGVCFCFGLTFRLCFQQICPTSSKVHTTRTFAKAIGVRNNSQIILFDTPGLVTEQQIKKHNLSSEFMSSCRHSIQHSNLIGVIHDVSNSWTRNELHSTVLDTLKAYPKVPSFLVLNKIDMLKSKRILLDVTKTLTENTLLPRGIRRPKSILKEEKQIVEKSPGWPGFSDVFMISSLNGDGMTDVMVRK